MIRKDEKTAVIEANRTHETDTGSPEVQIAILTARINQLTEHLRVHIHDAPSSPSWASVSENGIRVTGLSLSPFSPISSTKILPRRTSL